MNVGIEDAAHLHENTPPNWYNQSIKIDLLQRIWHKKRFIEATRVIEEMPNGKILDIGCADGTFSKVILDKSKASKLIGVDVLKTSIAWAKNHWSKNSKMKFQLGDAHKLIFSANTFDAVFAMEVLEHVADPKLVLKEVERVLKKGGYGVFLVPSDSTLFKIVWYLWLHFYPRGWVWNHTHIQTYRGNFLTRISKEAGFKIENDKKYSLGMLHMIKVRKV